MEIALNTNSEAQFLTHSTIVSILCGFTFCGCNLLAIWWHILSCIALWEPLKVCLQQTLFTLEKGTQYFTDSFYFCLWCAICIFAHRMS